MSLLVLVVALLAGEWHLHIIKPFVFPFAAEWPYSSLLSLHNYWNMHLMPYQVRLLQYVLEKSEKDNPTDVVAKVDDFGWAWPTMNVGNVKGSIVDASLLAMGVEAKVVVELGSYCGYSTLRLGSVLRKSSQEAVLYSVDPHPLGHAVKLALLDRAGLSGPKVVNELGYSGDVLRRLAKEGRKIDFLFIDHAKAFYLEDAELAIDLGVLRKGSVLVADNVLNPGVPEYRAWMLANKRFETQVISTKLEYSKVTPDEILISTFLG